MRPQREEEEGGILIWLPLVYTHAPPPPPATFILARSVQGMSFALINVAGLSMLIQVSPDLTKDIGQQETFVGLALGTCPALFGLFYERLGFTSVFLFLASLMLVLIVLVLVLTALDCISFQDNSNTSTPVGNEQASSQDEGGEGTGGAFQLPPVGVLFSATTVMATFNSIGFLELAFAGHVKHLLHKGAVGAGLLFSE